MSLRICVVSNDGGYAGELVSRLGTWGHHAVRVAPGTDLRSHPLPHLFLLDLPIEGGVLFETVSRLQKGRDTRQVPLVVVSSDPEFEHELTHVFDYMPKPADLRRLQHDCDMIAHGVRRPARDTAEQFADADYRLFYDFLISRSGLRFDPHNVKFLARGIKSRMQVLHIQSHRDYFEYLTSYHESRQELQKLIQLLTVGETYFFRYRGQFEALGRIARKAFSRDGQGRLRIWSAGCSTGEEPYSIAMTVMDGVPQWKAADIAIEATDINKRSLRLAVEGVYRPWAMRAMDQHHVRRYFERAGDLFRIRDEVKRLVDFRHLNLHTSRLPAPDKGLAELDAIFCRNVLIYFDGDLIRRTVERLADTLRPGGHLFLGHSEVLSPVPASLERVATGGMFHYRKRKKTAVAVSQSSGRSQGKGADGASSGAVSSPSPTPGETDLDALFREALDLLDREEVAAASHRLEEVISRKPDHVEALATQGFIFASEGRVEESLALCSRALSLDDLLPAAYFVKAVLLEAVDQPAQAVAEYRKANLLDMNFLMSHYRLGRLFLRMHRKKDGLRELRTCLRILDRQGGDAPVPFGGGATRDGFAEQVASELALAEE